MTAVYTVDSTDRHTLKDLDNQLARRRVKFIVQNSSSYFFLTIFDNFVYKL